uniref:OTU deubiquitinase, ubiquitin aldehyde binding 2 n=1 Tax=Fundulus heteroclitus TaxID=8078 RepID=A0A3Q2QLD2_FUNHE
MEVCSLVSCADDISSLLPQETPPSPKYKDLGLQFSAVRKVRGDGNCFYRAVCFAHLESALHSPRAMQRFKDQIIQSEEVLVSAGFDEASFSHHQSTVLQVVNQCMAAEQEDTLLRLFNQQLISDSVVQFLRLLTSAHLQTHADFFCNFVEAPDLKAYCRQVGNKPVALTLEVNEEELMMSGSFQEVELMAMECDHVDILALSQALDVGIHIVSMEGDEQQLVHHVIPEGADPAVRLLYQTSHYDILYRRTQP